MTVTHKTLGLSWGGGRYDRLLDIFDAKADSMPAIGFAMGDVTLENFLNEHGHIPKSLQASSGVFIALMSEDLRQECQKLADELRGHSVGIVEQSLHPSRKLGQQFSLAQKKGRRFVIVLGSEEIKEKQVSIKDLDKGSQEKINRDDIVAYIINAKS